MKFTQASVATAAKQATTEQFIWDDAMPGFGIRVRDGRARYVIQFRIGTKQRRMSLGNTLKVTLNDAQQEARRLFGDVARRIDPSAVRAKAEVAASRSFENAIEDFLAYQKDRISASWHYQSTLALRKRFKMLHGLSLTDIDRATVASALKEVKKVGLRGADLYRSALSKFFTWAIGEGLCEDNPVRGTNKAGGEYEKRERTLSHDEIRKVWNALDDYTTFGRVMKVLLLTGQRRCEIGDLRWSEVDFDNAVMHLPKERSKNGKALDVPLSALALDLLKACRQRKDSEFMFGNHAGFTNWFKSKRELDAVVKIPHWTIHDLRRTASTLMNDELDVAPHVVEAILNHVSGARSAHSGIGGKYNMAKYLGQKQEALDLYAKHIASIVGPTKPGLKLVA